MYCGFDRFEAREDGKWYDKGMISNRIPTPAACNAHSTDIDEVLSKSNSFEGCKARKPEVAYVLVTEGNTPSQLQLCPWFIDWMQGIDIKNIHNVEKKSIFYNVLSKGLTKMHAFLTPIDVRSLLDKTILHELMHTRNGGQAMDVDAEGGLLRVRYRWKRCRELALEGPDDPKREAQVNADTIALAASGISPLRAPKGIC